MDVKEAASRFDQVSALLPAALRCRLDLLPQRARARAEELRLRVGRPLYVVYPEGEEPIQGTLVEPDTLRRVLEVASGASVHTVMDQMKYGAVPVQGGHRLGLCGTGVVKEGILINLRAVSSLSLRIAREVRGIAGEVLPGLTEEGELASTLLLSPPGGGKTTLLRELIRVLSAGEGCTPMRVGVADERGELAAMSEGIPMLDLGPRTDVMDGCPKADALLALLRGMNPQVLACDEITARHDLDAMLQASGCGVKLLATAHASGLEDLDRRPLYRDLLAQKVFDRFVIISGRGSERRFAISNGAGAPC